MKILLIQGSLKVSGSNSGSLLDMLIPMLPAASESVRLEVKDLISSPQKRRFFADGDIAVFAFPLYVDGLPSPMIRALHSLEAMLSGSPHKNACVYAIVNCGFYEGRQNALAMEMMQHWCEKSGLKWCGGVGIGAGGMMSHLKDLPNNNGLKKPVYESLRSLAAQIAERKDAGVNFACPRIPKIAYKIGAEHTWRHLVKANGLKTKDLFRRV